MHSKTPKRAKPFNKYSIALFVAAILLIPGGWLFAYVWHWQNRPHVLEIYCFSVGGDMTIFIRTPEGQTALIDGGAGDAILGDLTSVMPFYDHSIDSLILTDNDDSNATGLVSVLGRYRVGQIFEMENVATSTSAYPTASSSLSYAAFEKIIADKNISRHPIIKGDTFNIGELIASAIFPDPSFKFSKTNIPTLAFQLGYASTTLFFVGDMTKTEQKYVATGMASSSADLALSFSTILILPHGENVAAVDENFFDAISPNYVIVSKKPRAVQTVKSAKSEKLLTPSQSSKKPPKPPFDISSVSGISIINLATDGDTEFISSGKSFTQKKL